MTTPVKNIYGHSIASVIRFLGREGLTNAEATQALAAYGFEVYPTSIRAHLGAGRLTSPRYDATTIAPLNRNQRAEILRAARTEVPVKRKALRKVVSKPARKPAASAGPTRAAAVIDIQTRRITLAYNKGTSDKVYTVVLASAGFTAHKRLADRFHVDASYGRRGGTMQTDRKTTRGPVDLIEALEIMSSLVVGKLTKGYAVVPSKSLAAAA